MNKLLKTWAANPSLENARKIQAYDRKHPFARVMVSPSDETLIASAIYQAAHES